MQGLLFNFFWMFGLISGKGQCCEIIFLELEQPEREVAKAHCVLQYLTVINCKQSFFIQRMTEVRIQKRGCCDSIFFSENSTSFNVAN